MAKSFKEIPVLFENSCCFIFNKPPGLPVQGGEGVKISLDSILSEKYQPRPLLVHRLDRDTSGLILVAKTKEAARGFSALFAANAARLVTKLYLGLCSGHVKPDLGSISLELNVRAKGNTKTKKESETSYRRLFIGRAGGFPCSLLELKLLTGRTHQIRRHLSETGYPLLGDDKYGDFSLNKQLRKAIGLKHLLLHASRFVIPSTPELLPGGLDIVAPLPDYFSPLLEGFTAGAI